MITKRILGGQIYERVGVDERGLAIWRSHCARCGASFEIRQPDVALDRFAPNRRCVLHVKAGRRAARLRVEAVEGYPDMKRAA
jgi:hypothetical protein